MMKQIQADGLAVLPPGRQGENLARQIVFDIQARVILHGSVTAELICQHPIGAVTQLAYELNDQLINGSTITAPGIIQITEG